ncbi:MAG: 1-phosphatidylinositol 4,5-bisphosphate phosphodiesterase delta-4 [Marteilia pararefringens]
MAELALKYSSTASRAFTDSILKKPLREVQQMMSGINVGCQSATTKKISSEKWRLDQNSNSIICERTGGLRLYMCSPNFKHLDVTTITKIKDSDEAPNVVVMTHLDPELAKNVIMHLSFDDEEKCISFLKVIGYLMSKARLDDAHYRQFEYLCKVFNRLDEDNNGFLTFSELDKLYSTLKIRKKEELFAVLFREVQHESPKGMTLSEFILFYNTLYSLPDILLIFCTYAYSNGSINMHQFMRFLKLEQYEKNVSASDAQKILQDLEVNDNAMRGLELTINGFVNYMFEPVVNGMLNPKFYQKPHQDMDRPLNNYYIKSCYVTGNNPTDLANNYRYALAMGYRHFELDIYSSDVFDSVYVGTSKESSPTLELSELAAIFNKADLEYGPLILTMRLNINSPKALILIANTLLVKMKENQPILFDEDTVEMPSLSRLCRKVLIRSNIAKVKEIEKTLKTQEEILFSSLIALDDVDFSKFESSPVPSENDNTDKQDPTSKDSNTDQNATQAFNSVCESDAFNNYKWNQTITFQADSFALFGDKQNLFAMEITNSFLVSVSPKNSYQICSPTLFWNFGVHSVVQPFPRTDIFSQLNDAFFLLNGNCGYALKPDDIQEAVLINQQDRLLTDNVNKENFSIQKDTQNNYQNSLPGVLNFEQNIHDTINITISVICGRFMPSLNIKPFVYLELYGPIPMYGTTDISDTTKISYKINPRYNNQFEFELPKSAYKQTLIAISLFDNQALSMQNDNQVIGRAVAHIANMRQGFRNVTLYNLKGECLDPTSLLIHVRKTFLRDYANMTSYASTIVE